jgi:hypothetical protein
MKIHNSHKRENIVRRGRRVALARHLFADLGCAIGEIENDVYTDRFIEIADVFSELIDFDDNKGLRLTRMIIPLMQEIEVNREYIFEWNFRSFRVAEKIFWIAEPKIMAALHYGSIFTTTTSQETEE